MYKNLNCEALGVSGRQSEIIELALTYRFGGIDLDMAEFCKQVELRGLEYARRFLDSAKIKIGAFDLPIRWQGEDTIYRETLAKLPQIAEIAASMGALRCRTVVMPTCAERPYHENFEFHRHRLAEIAELLSPHDIRMGLDFLAPAYHREDSQYHFISTAEPLILLAKTVGMPNVGVTLDVWNWHVGGGNFADLLKELTAEQIVSVRLADLPPDADRETVREEQRLLPSRGGVVDSVAVLRHARDIGYEGPVTAYPHPSQCPSKTRDTIVKQAGEILDELWKAMDAEEEVQPASAPAAE